MRTSDGVASSIARTSLHVLVRVRRPGDDNRRATLQTCPACAGQIVRAAESPDVSNAEPELIMMITENGDVSSATRSKPTRRFPG
jgi:hypothetical protein